MVGDDLYSMERSMDMRVRQELRQAEASRLGKLARAQNQGAVSGWVRGLACEVGYLLVALGARLEQYGLPEPLSLRGQTSG
jgi:hypothetical protein